MTSSFQPSGRAELVAGSRTLVASILGVASGVSSLPFYTSGLFIAALHADLGWSLTSLSLGPTVLIASMALSAPLVGHIFDRYGERRFILPGLLAQALGFLLLSRMNGLVGYCVLMGGTALLGAGCSSPAYLRVVNRRFQASKGAALALTISGSAVFSAVLPPILQGIIAAHGWRGGYVALSILVLIAAPAIMLLLGGERAASMPLVEPVREGPDDFRYGGLFRSRAFAPLMLAITLISIGVPGLLIHFVPMAMRSGMSAQQAAWIVSLIGGTQIITRVAIGIIVDRLFAPRVAASIMVASAIGILILAWGGDGSIVIGAIAVGFAFGAEADLLGYLAGRYYPPHHFGRVYGIFYAIFLGGMALSPSAYGMIVDRAGSYGPALICASILLFAAALLFLILPAFPVSSSRIAGVGDDHVS
ncbi:MFS transporter [Sphingobium sp. HWE2-09]|uniref:MFS transporter n=1 Tax=Sphingobium sp. HWE2-09 TaxID=3108390 RepID=UPI002DD36E94|nr:MFS transporter [Sphingobium sp. HWE2-09]